MRVKKNAFLLGIAVLSVFVVLAGALRANDAPTNAELDTMIDQYTELISVYSESLKACSRNTYYHFLRGQFGRTVVDVVHAAQLYPAYTSAYYNRGLAYMYKGEQDKAIKDFTKAVRFKPNYTEAYFSRAYAYAQKREFDKAMADCNEAIRLDSQNAYAFLARGFVFALQNEREKAIADFSESIRLKPDNAGALRYRARAYGKQEQYAQAIADLTQSVQIQPDNAACRNALAWLQATCPNEKYRNGNEAIVNAQKACELVQGDHKWACLDTLATAYAETGDYAKARELQEEVVKKADDKNREGCRSRLELYKQGKPYHEEAKKK